MRKWLLCVGVVLAFLFAVVPFLSADEASPVAPSKEVVKPKAETPKPATIPKLTDEQKAKAEKLIKNLGNDDFATREAAEETLKKMSVAVLPLAKKATTSSDAEVAQRAARIVVHLDPIKVTLSTDKKKYKIGERVRLTLQFTNLDKEMVLLPMGNANYPWHEASNYVLSGPDGKAIEFKGKASPPKLKRQQMVLAPGKTFTQKSFVSLVKLLPKPDPKIPPVADGRDQTIEKDEKAKVKAPIGFLHGNTGQYHFALATPGKYTLKFRFVAKGEKAQPQPRKRVLVPQQKRPMGVQGRRPWNPGPDPSNATKRLDGLMESNTVTFEIVE